MEPKSFSASALHVAELCLSRYRAENIERSRGIGGTAASLGTSVHGALEMYVKLVYLEKKAEPDQKMLLDFFKMSYIDTFSSNDIDTEDYKDGVNMLKSWFKRNELGQENRTVISCEIKDNFPIQTSLGPIPFNYIWDRFDKTGVNEYTVVDYKSNRWGINPQDLKGKLQARCYALAAQIQLKEKNPDRIWVEFDMLRHEGPVGVVFSREENAATWHYIKDLAQRIIDTKNEDVRETLNPECNFCVKKQSCGAVLKNITSGGILTITSATEAVDKRVQLEYQKKVITKVIEEMDEIILTEARKTDVLAFESETNWLNVGISSQRSVEPDFVEKVIGPELFRKYGGMSFTIGNVDKLLKGNEITADQKIALADLIYKKKGQPRVTIKAKDFIE